MTPSRGPSHHFHGLFYHYPSADTRLYSQDRDITKSASLTRDTTIKLFSMCWGTDAWEVADRPFGQWTPEEIAHMYAVSVFFPGAIGGCFMRPLTSEWPVAWKRKVLLQGQTMQRSFSDSSFLTTEWPKHKREDSSSECQRLECECFGCYLSLASSPL